MEPIKVLVHGASGRMGREVMVALCREPALEPVAAVEKHVVEEYLSLPDGSGLIPFSSDVEQSIVRSRPDVIVDFSEAGAAVNAARMAFKHGVRFVSGTTGISDREIEELQKLATANSVGGVVAPNFALGAVLMIHLAKTVSRFFDYAEILEMHHEQKLDAPSGTALTTAREMIEARGRPFAGAAAQKETLPNTRGGQMDGIAIHAIRLPGLLAHQEVIFGGAGQTLTIRHDTISRESFIPGLILAVKEVMKLNRLVMGLDTLLGL